METEIQVREAAAPEAVLSGDLGGASEVFMSEARSQIRVVIADRFPLVGDGLRALIDGDERFRTIGTAIDAPEAIEIATAESPDVVVLDLGIPHALSAIAHIRENRPSTKIIALVERDDARMMRLTTDAGATALAVRTAPASELVAAIGAVAAGSAYQPPLVGPRTASSEPTSGTPSRVTPREREVLVLYATAYTTKGIAKRLGLSPKTVESHRASLYRKLGCSSVVELVLTAIRQEFVQI